MAHACDVRDPHSVDALFRAARRKFKRLDILINNAGIAHPNLPIEKLPLPLWKDVVDTNLTGMFLVTQAALAIMKRGGTIVNNLSIAATRVFAGSAAYNASKHGALGLTNTLREELRPRGIRVIALLPGATSTDIWTTLWPQAPRKKMMSPQTVAEATVQAILLPANATVESLEILPTARHPLEQNMVHRPCKTMLAPGLLSSRAQSKYNCDRQSNSGGSPNVQSTIRSRSPARC